MLCSLAEEISFTWKKKAAGSSKMCVCICQTILHHSDLWGPEISQIFKFTSHSVLKGKCILALHRSYFFCAFFQQPLVSHFHCIVCTLSRNENTTNVLESGAAFFIVQTLRVIYPKTRQWGSKINLTTWCTLPPVNYHLWEKSEGGR